MSNQADKRSDPTADQSLAQPPANVVRLTQSYFKVSATKESATRMARRFLIGAVCMAVLIPALFYLQAGRLDALSWGFTIFSVVLFLLMALGFFFMHRTEYHTPVAMRGDWLDKLGGFWLVACGFGPLLGWMITSPLLGVTLDSWRWQYTARVALSVGVPILTAMPLLRYARGKTAIIALPLLLGLTSLPVLTGAWSLWDLLAGPVVREAQIAKGYVGKVVILDDQPLNFSLDAYPWAKPGSAVIITWLPHTGRVINISPTPR
jgi:hypothetical protein